MLWILSAVALYFGVHWAYVLVMSAKSRLPKLTLYWKVMLAPAAVLGLLLDFAFNYTFGFMFLAWPRPVLFSSTVQHHYRESSGWRVDLAEFFARQLNIFDERHIH